MSLHSRQQSAIQDSRSWGLELADYFLLGGEPVPAVSPIALGVGERYYYSIPIQMCQWVEGDATYAHSSGVAIGSIGFMAAFYAMNAIGNAARRARAQREAQPQWHYVGECQLHLTDRRIALQGLPQWVDIRYELVRSSSCDGLGVTLDVVGWPQTQFIGPLADYWFGLFRKLAYGEIVKPAYGQSAL